MPLFQIAEHIHITDNLKQPHRGRVVKIDDTTSKKYGRLKCLVKGMFEDSSEDFNKLPWVYPQNPTGLGGRPDSSGFTVPELDSEVTVTFPTNDIYHPFYSGYWRSELTRQPLIFDEDYPNSYGFIDSVIEWFKVNKKVGGADNKSYLEFFRKYLGDLFRLDEDGNMWINIPKSLYLKIGEDVRVEVVKNQINKVGENAYQDVGGDRLVKIGVDDLQEIFGNHTQKIGGNSTASIGGSQEWGIGATQGITCGGAMSHEAVKIDHNSGINFGMGAVDGAALVSKMGSKHQVELQELQTKMIEMKNKIDELTALAVDIKAKSDTNRPLIANPSNTI